MATIPPADEAVYRMLWKADTVGLFQVESRAQMAMLPRTKPRNYYDLVIQISIIRPGPIVGGMVHPYLRRRDGEEAIEYPHPALEPILRRTLGIPLFQEQIMRLAMVAADYTPGEADQLRRDMAAWKKAGRLEAHRERLIGRMVAKGVAQEFAERVFQQISGFGEYGFPESHAASFALIAYATAWMKWHYRTAFTAALLNSQPMGFYSVATIVDDAKRHGVVVHPPDVLKSDWDCLLEPHADDFSLRMGIRYVKGIAKGQWQQIARVCEGTAPASIEELSRRSGQGPAVMSKLAEAGALRGLQADRRTALWQAHAPAAPVDQLALEAEESALEWEDLDRFDEISWDYDSSGYSAVDHPLAPMRDRLAGKGLPTAAEVWGTADGTQVSFAGLVICRQRPGTASGVLFITLEDETGFVNLILWPKVFEKNRQLARTASLLGVTGKLQAENGVVHLIAERLWVPRIPKQPERRSPRWGTGRP
jgi:error-prone DNA polymerase